MSAKFPRSDKVVSIFKKGENLLTVEQAGQFVRGFERADPISRLLVAAYAVVQMSVELKWPRPAWEVVLASVPAVHIGSYPLTVSLLSPFNWYLDKVTFTRKWSSLLSCKL